METTGLKFDPSRVLAKAEEITSSQQELSTMAAIQIPDSTGNTMALKIQQKRPQFFTNPAFNVDILNDLPDMPLRDDDILLCSYSKAGCHWLWEIARQIVSGQDTTESIEKESSMIELHTVFGDLDTLPSPRILNTHTFFEVQPKDMLKKKLKVLFIYRNPKDVAVSYFHHVKRLPDIYNYTGDFSAFLIRFVEGLLDNNGYFDYMKSWESGIQNHPDLNIFILTYEDLKEDPLPVLRKLAKFLGKERSDEFLTSVNANTQFHIMKKKKGDIIKTSDGDAVMYRKGEVGDWKNHFTVAQNEWFDHIIRSRLGGSDLFKFKYTV